MSTTRYSGQRADHPLLDLDERPTDIREDEGRLGVMIHGVRLGAVHRKLSGPDGENTHPWTAYPSGLPHGELGFSFGTRVQAERYLAEHYSSPDRLKMAIATEHALHCATELYLHHLMEMRLAAEVDHAYVATRHQAYADEALGWMREATDRLTELLDTEVL